MGKYEKYKAKGYPLVKETKNTAIFQVPKKFNGLAFLAWILLFNVFGLAGYLIYYGAKLAVRDVMVIK